MKTDGEISTVFLGSATVFTPLLMIYVLLVHFKYKRSSSTINEMMSLMRLMTYVHWKRTLFQDGYEQEAAALVEGPGIKIQWILIQGALEQVLPWNR